MSHRVQTPITLPIATRHARRLRPRASSRRRLLFAAAAALACVMLLPGSALAFNFSFLGSLHTVSSLGSTVPGNGDKNPYGIVTVPRSVGLLTRGDLLISNFNDEGNLQGTGTTLVQVSPSGHQSLFAQINPATLRSPAPAASGSRQRWKSCPMATWWSAACLQKLARPKNMRGA